MVMAQKLKEAEITEQDSLLLTRNLLRIAIFNISYIRGLFPENYFNDKSVPALDMKIKKLLPIDPESRRLIDWMEKGVYDALQKKYLKTLMFCICESVEGPMIEEYSFNFSYSDSDSQDVRMNISRTGTKKHGGTFHSTADITQNQMRSSACKMVRTLVQLMRTLDKMPDKRTIVMKLMYYDDVTPPDYEPPFFRGCTEEEAQHVWTKDPLRMEVGNVNSKHLVLTLKVKSVLDPCADENDDMQDDGKSTGPNSVHDEQPSDSDSEISQTRETQFLLAPVEKQEDDDGEVDEDNTQDPVESQQQLERVKGWINSRHLDTLELTDVLANFPDISIALTEEIMDQLEKEGVLSKTGKETYTINREKTPRSEFIFVKDEDDGKTASKDEKSIAPEDYMYMKALYHSLPMQYVTITKLHNMLDGEANQTKVRKLIDRMIQEGYVEDSSNRRLGKRVIHSVFTENKLNEIRKVLATNDDMDVDVDETVNKTNGQDAKLTPDVSTRGGIHSIGSDLTRTKGRSAMQQNGSVLSEQTISKANNTPMSSNAQPVASRESFAVKGMAAKICTDAGTDSSQASQDKRYRKTSTVRDPILQYSKRQKSQAN